jgi:hypothetical protein
VFIGWVGDVREQRVCVTVSYAVMLEGTPVLTRCTGRLSLTAHFVAQVVLMLRFHNVEEEFKISRLMLAFATRSFVISERMGIDADAALYRGGMVQLAPPDIIVGGAIHFSPAANETLEAFAAGVKHYLALPALRRAVAEEGHRLFASLRMAHSLKQALCMRSRYYCT